MSPINIIFGVGALVAFGVLAVGLVLSLRPQPTAEQVRLGRFADVGTPQATAAVDSKPKKRGSPLGEWLNNLLTRRGIGKEMRTWLGRANLKINIGEYLALLVITTIGGGFVFMLGSIVPDCINISAEQGGMVPCMLRQSTSVPTILVTIGGAAIGFFGPRIYIDFLIGRRRKMFEDQLGDALSLMVNGIRAGYSILQAMEAVGRELPPPISEEFRRIVQEVQLGVNMEQAFEHLLQRMPSADLDLAVTAINIQREVGGNLAEILDVIAYTIRERVRIKGEINTLTAQGMMTGTVISILPLGLMGILYFISRRFIMMFFENGWLGYSMLAVAGVLILVGWLIVRKVVTIEI